MERAQSWLGLVVVIDSACMCIATDYRSRPQQHDQSRFGGSNALSCLLIHVDTLTKIWMATGHPIAIITRCW